MATLSPLGRRTLPTCCRYKASDAVGLNKIATPQAGILNPSDMTSTETNNRNLLLENL